MGWKSVKEAYQIEHIVKNEGDVLKIGSGYVGDLITVHPDGRVVMNSIVSRDGGELDRIRIEMEADPDRLRGLLAKHDHFDVSLPVWTYEDGAILELHCEEYGWPNVTHDGRLMYENLFFDRRDQAVEAAIRNGEYAVEGWTDSVERAKKDLETTEAHLERVRSNLESYRKEA